MIRSNQRNFERLFALQDFSNVVAEVEANVAMFDLNTFRQDFEGSPFKDTTFIPCRMSYDYETQPSEEELIEHLTTKGITNTDAIDTPEYACFPAVYSVVMWLAAIVQAEQIGRVLITKCFPKGHILAHKDFGEYHDFYDRYHICLTGRGCHFRSGREMVKMLPGEVWWFYNNEEHEVWNDGSEPRIHIVMDFKLKGDKNAYRASGEIQPDNPGTQADISEALGGVGA